MDIMVGNDYSFKEIRKRHCLLEIRKDNPIIDNKKQIVRISDSMEITKENYEENRVENAADHNADGAADHNRNREDRAADHNIEYAAKETGRVPVKRERRSRKITFGRSFYCFLLAVVSILPMIQYLCYKIPFTYEVNDDAMLVQILDGSYTGTPDAHSIFLRYPLSWVISRLYHYRLPGNFLGINLQNANWYIATLVILETLAMILVLHRMLTFFNCNLLLICFAFDAAFIFIWMQCFFRITFSTAGAFFGCMAILYLAFLTRENAHLPWNMLILLLLMVCTYCMRKQCFYMVAPFLIGEFIYKYHMYLFRSIKPWILLLTVSMSMFGIVSFDAEQYASKGWQRYFTYNHARAYMQDYVGFPTMEEAEGLYTRLGITPQQRYAMENYSYCLVDDFSPRWVVKIYKYITKREEKIELNSAEGIGQMYEEYADKAYRFFFSRKGSPQGLKFHSMYLLLMTLPVLVLTVLFRWPYGRWTIVHHLWDIVSTAGFYAVLSFEWFYLAMNGRFPRRVEETIRLTTLAVAILLLAHFLNSWKKSPYFKLPAWFQLIFVILMLIIFSPLPRVDKLAGEQQYQLSYVGDRAEIMDYCATHEDSFYILDTLSFTRMAKPLDRTNQGNWIMSANWATYSPLYKKKLKNIGTKKLDSQFLTRKNVYIIAKSHRSLRNMLGVDSSTRVESVIADEITASSNNIYEVYKIIRVEKTP